ncbi:uncharacterized protein E0L32_000087 [Thyridium curvatum]|uniref:Uncharacterized protein n=1 Tax=Thyridium curvatum TaxID=1093900 RepID=A0A507B7T5_9PEZI|nr:uncharacterized protein E0L32_000087 [Thyridium curvatum]TPX15753.1 hypothetical protein E0L32_000087 [Thyridium curvatum]
MKGRSHVSLKETQGVNVAHLYNDRGVARDWSPQRKRCVATVACISTAMIGVLIGIYAGLVPALQYYIGDDKHYTILGNVFFYLGLAVTTLLFWPLPLLHGRKPYILTSLILAMPLLYPQAISVAEIRSPFVHTWRWCLLGSRAFMGLVLGFASMNFHSILTDLFGASLMSSYPHQELADKYDVRRHGGGMGVWLGIWTWCFMGSLAVGFFIGAAIINTQHPSWGFYVSIIILAFVMVLNVVCPETRPSAYRRSVMEVRDGDEISTRIARGEVMMHRVKTGPRWWGEEVYHGLRLSVEMISQPGFAAVALYFGWTYCQFVLIIILLGSLTSRYYSLRSSLVGLCVAGVAVGALVGVPFQKANIFSRARYRQKDLAHQSRARRVAWTSHLLRRTVFTALLPLMSMAYSLASRGTSTPIVIPVALAAVIGFLSCLAVAECNGLIMETFDCSDLQPATSRRRRTGSPKRLRRNFSSFPRVTAGFAISHAIAFILAAGTTGVGGLVRRRLGQQAATGVGSGILVALTALFSAVLVRFKTVQVVPETETSKMEKWDEVRRHSLRRRSAARSEGGGRTAGDDLQGALQDAEPWRPPLVLGSPTHPTRRMNLLELGSMTRWSEIRRKNRVIDEWSN